MKASGDTMLATRDAGVGATPFMRPGAPRRAFWALLTCALAISFAFPLITLWHVTSNGLSARACMWPASPRTGDVAQALVVIPTAAATAERAAASAGALKVQVVATMPDRRMEAEQATAAPAPQQTQGPVIFIAPLTITMPGSWEARFTAFQAGRVIWMKTVEFSARTGSWGALPLSTQSARPAQTCGVASAGATRAALVLSAPQSSHGKAVT